MLIGIDFDNTIVSYDTLFHKIAIEQGAVPPSTLRTKLAVRDHLRAIGKEAVWTEMQGYVYGARMAEADAYPGVLDFLKWARAGGIEICIVSHKTKHPFIGPSYDLHQAARHWIERNLIDDKGALLPAEQIFFELTKEEKLNRVGTLQCDWFLDDLPEILLAADFPERVSRLLFDPDEHHKAISAIPRMATWSAIQRHFEQACHSKS